MLHFSEIKFRISTLYKGNYNIAKYLPFLCHIFRWKKKKNTECVFWNDKRNWSILISFCVIFFYKLLTTRKGMKNSTFESESPTKRLGVKRVDDRYFPRSIATRNCFYWLKKDINRVLHKGKIPAFTFEHARGLKYRNNCFKWKFYASGVQYRLSAIELHWNSRKMRIIFAKNVISSL